MHLIRARNVHRVLPLGLRHLDAAGCPMPSRAGDVIVAPGPVTTVYERPRERVLFWPERDANPFLHFFDGLHLLAGRNDVALLSRFAKRMALYSDDGMTLHGAYGHRLRHHFSTAEHHSADQIAVAIDLLRHDPFSRRVVLTMWDAEEDLGRNGADLPCNTQVYVNTSYGERDRPNRLNILVCNRSNDIIWGAYGANAVQFSMLQEYIAAHLGLDIGNYYQMSMNYHAYTDIYTKTRVGNLRLWNPTWNEDPYSRGEVAPYQMVADPNTWNTELARFLEEAEADRLSLAGWANPFFPYVAAPLWLAHAAYKARDYTPALALAQSCAATDWARAVREWLERRQQAKQRETER